MRTADVINLYGSTLEAGRVLGISRQAVDQWGEVVPEGSAYKLQVITGGRLQVDPSCYPKGKVMTGVNHGMD